MNKNNAPAWPYCETTEVLERRGRRRTLLVEIAVMVLLIGGPVAVWQGLVMYGTAMAAAV